MEEIEKAREKALEKGKVNALLYFDIHGQTEEEIKDLVAVLIRNLLKEQGVLFVKGEIDPQLTVKEGERIVYGLEVEVITRDFFSLAYVVAKYIPISLLIISPEEIKMSIEEFENILKLFAQVSFEYKHHYMKQLPVGEREKFKKMLENSIKLGRKLREKYGGSDKNRN